MFANQVLAEANKRGVTIDGVLKASDIKFENGKIYMQAGKDIIAETPVVEEVVKAEIKMDENGQTKLFQPMTRSSFTEFKDFFNNVINNKNSGKKEQYNYLTKDGLNLRIVHDTILHDVKDKHKLQANDWEDFLNNIDNVEIAENSKHKARYNGKPVLLKVKSGDKVYGAVIEIFKKNNPIITTAFYDDEAGIDNWIKNEAVSSGTKTTFSNISLNNIITNVSPNFKTKVIKNGENNTKLYQETDQTETEAFKKWFGDSKVVDENGKPFVVYHGTNNDFDTFIIDYPSQAMGNFKGAYFVDNISEAKDYGDNIKAVYVKIENPLIGNPCEEYAKAKGLDYEKSFFDIKKEQVENWIKEMNFDGIIRPKKSQYNLSGMEVIPFSANQIKSVDNQGTFDENNPNIYYQLKGLPKQKKVRQGSFDYSTKAIELFKTADYSTLPHELAHYWLDNMWGYYRSGKASEAINL